MQELLAVNSAVARISRPRPNSTKNQVALLRDYDIRPVIFIRLSELISHGTVTGQRTSTTRSARFLPNEPNIRTLRAPATDM